MPSMNSDCFYPATCLENFPLRTLRQGLPLKASRQLVMARQVSIRAEIEVRKLAKGIRITFLSMSSAATKLIVGVSLVLPKSTSLSVKPNSAIMSLKSINIDEERIIDINKSQIPSPQEHTKLKITRRSGFSHYSKAVVILWSLFLYYRMEETTNIEGSEIPEQILQSPAQPQLPQVQHQSSIVEMHIEDSLQGDNKPDVTVSPRQIKVTLQVPEENLEGSEPTKRSDESQFVNWQISTIKSGKFFFSEKKQPQKEEIKREEDIDLKADQGSGTKQGQKKSKEPKLEKRAGREKSKGTDDIQIKIKVPKTLSNTKKQLERYFREEFEGALVKNKTVKMLFSHFCKQNNLTSIKSTLFEDKLKVMEEMTLNKWMVFCKEFDFLERFCASHFQAEARSPEATKNNQTKQQARVKQLKAAQTTLINIFKTISQSRSKITFDHFVQGLLLIFYQLKSDYTHDEDGARRFMGEALHCSTQKQCLMKLSCLKFTASTPKISFQKPTSRPLDLNPIEKSRFSRHREKENAGSSGGKVKVGTTPSKRRDKLNVNPVISQAKLTVMKNEASKYSNHQKNKTKLILQDIRQNKKEKSNSQKELFQYFDSTKDPILDSYFVLEKRKEEGEK